MFLPQRDLTLITHQKRVFDSFPGAESGAVPGRGAEEGEGQLFGVFCSAVRLVLIFGSIKSLAKVRLYLLAGQEGPWA